MSDAVPLRPTTADEIAEVLMFGFQYDNRQVHWADGLMARITVDRIVRYLEQSGFVLMKRLPQEAPTSSHVTTSAGA